MKDFPRIAWDRINATIRAKFAGMDSVAKGMADF